VTVGIEPTQEHIEKYAELKVDKKYRYIILALNKERNALEILRLGDRSEGMKELEPHLPKDNCVYVVYDFEYDTYESPPRQTAKLLLICWVPDNCSSKIKVPFAGTKSSVRGAFAGIQKDVQASDFSYLDVEDLRKECCNK